MARLTILEKILHYKSKDNCPDVSGHTDCPKGYLAWYEWSRQKMKTHNQKRCPTCGFYSIWVPKKRKPKQ